MKENLHSKESKEKRNTKEPNSSIHQLTELEKNILVYNRPCTTFIRSVCPYNCQYKSDISFTKIGNDLHCNQCGNLSLRILNKKI